MEIGVNTNYAAIIVSGGVSFAEGFAGRTNTLSGAFDILSSIPLNHLL